MAKGKQNGLRKRNSKQLSNLMKEAFEKTVIFNTFLDALKLMTALGDYNSNVTWPWSVASLSITENNIRENLLIFSLTRPTVW